jgi:hypothetical protein
VRAQHGETVVEGLGNHWLRAGKRASTYYYDLLRWSDVAAAAAGVSEKFSHSSLFPPRRMRFPLSLPTPMTSIAA